MHYLEFIGTPFLYMYCIIGERAKRARRYLVMFMETRDIYIYICTSVSNTHVRVNVFFAN